MRKATINKLNILWEQLKKIDQNSNDLEENSYIYDKAIDFLSNIGPELNEVVQFMIRVNHHNLRFSGIGGSQWKFTTHGFLNNALTSEPKWHQIR